MVRCTTPSHFCVQTLHHADVSSSKLGQLLSVYDSALKGGTNFPKTRIRILLFSNRSVDAEVEKAMKKTGGT